MSRPTGVATWRRLLAAVCALLSLSVIQFGLAAEREAGVAVDLLAARDTVTGTVIAVEQRVQRRGPDPWIATVRLPDGREPTVEGRYPVGTQLEVLADAQDGKRTYSPGGKRAPAVGLGVPLMVGGALVALHCLQAARARTNAARTGRRKLAAGGRAIVTGIATTFAVFPPLFAEGTTSFVPAAAAGAVVLGGEVLAWTAHIDLERRSIGRRFGPPVPLGPGVELDPDSGTAATYLDLVDAAGRRHALWITLWDDPPSLARHIVDACRMRVVPDDAGSAGVLARLAAIDRARARDR